MLIICNCFLEMVAQTLFHIERWRSGAPVLYEAAFKHTTSLSEINSNHRKARAPAGTQETLKGHYKCIIVCCLLPACSSGVQCREICDGTNLCVGMSSYLCDYLYCLHVELYMM